MILKVALNAMKMILAMGRRVSMVRAEEMVGRSVIVDLLRNY